MTFNRNKLRFALLMSWRETRAAAGKFAFLVLAIALGTGSTDRRHRIQRVGPPHALARSTLADGRRYFRAPAAAAAQVGPRTLEEPRSPKALRRRESRKPSAWRPRAGHVPVLISVKGADLAALSLLRQAGAGSRREPGSTTNSVAVSDDLLLRLGIQPRRLNSRRPEGVSRCRAGRQRAGQDDDGIHAGTARAFHARRTRGTGIITDISRVTERVLLKLPEKRDLAALRAQLESAYGKRASITDYTQTNPTLTRALDRATRFLSMVSLIALIVGGLGVGATMQSHLRQKMTNIAFMKCIGGRSEHILYIYLAQALWLGILGSVLGAVLGAFAQAVFARLVANYFDVNVTLDLAVGGDAAGDRRRTHDNRAVFSAAAARHPKHPPRVIAAEDLRGRILDSPGSGESGSPGLWPSCGLWGIAVWVSGSSRYASVFAGSLIAGICILGLLGAALLRIMKRASSLAFVRHSRALRHGIGNLYRPGAHSVAILTSLAIGVMFVMSVYFIQHSLLDEIRIAAPPDAPNVFLINITQREKDGVSKILESDPAIVNRPAAVTGGVGNTGIGGWNAHRSALAEALPRGASRIRFSFSRGARMFRRRRRSSKASGGKDAVRTAGLGE